MKINLTYFKPTGKYYSDGEYESKFSSHWDIVAEVRAMAENGTLPGLVSRAKEFHVLIESDVPHMIWAGGKISTEYN